MSINKSAPERSSGPLKLVGTGDFEGCLGLTKSLFDKERALEPGAVFEEVVGT